MSRRGRSKPLEQRHILDAVDPTTKAERVVGVFVALQEALEAARKELTTLERPVIVRVQRGAGGQRLEDGEWVELGAESLAIYQREAWPAPRSAPAQGVR